MAGNDDSDIVIVAASICRILVLTVFYNSSCFSLLSDININFLANKYAAVICNMTLSLLVVSIVLHNFIIITCLSLPFVITNNADRTRFAIK